MMSVDEREARKLKRAALNSVKAVPLNLVKVEAVHPEPLLKESLFASSSSMMPMFSERRSSVQKSLESPSARRIKAKYIPRLAREASDSDIDFGEDEISSSSHLQRRKVLNSRRRLRQTPEKSISLHLIFSLFRLTWLLLVVGCVLAAIFGKPDDLQENDSNSDGWKNVASSAPIYNRFSSTEKSSVTPRLQPRTRYTWPSVGVTSTTSTVPSTQTTTSFVPSTTIVSSTTVNVTEDVSSRNRTFKNDTDSGYDFAEENKISLVVISLFLCVVMIIFIIIFLVLKTSSGSSDADDGHGDSLGPSYPLGHLSCHCSFHGKSDATLSEVESMDGHRRLCGTCRNVALKILAQHFHENEEKGLNHLNMFVFDVVVRVTESPYLLVSTLSPSLPAVSIRQFLMHVSDLFGGTTSDIAARQLLASDFIAQQSVLPDDKLGENFFSCLEELGEPVYDKVDKISLHDLQVDRVESREIDLKLGSSMSLPSVPVMEPPVLKLKETCSLKVEEPDAFPPLRSFLQLENLANNLAEVVDLHLRQ